MNDLLLQYKRETGLSPFMSYRELDQFVKESRKKMKNKPESFFEMVPTIDDAITDYTTDLCSEFHAECGYFNIPSPAYVRWLENKLKELQK